MVTITDARSGRRRPVGSARHGLIRICEHLALPDGAPGIADMRVIVVGDVLLRAVERGGRQAALVWSVPEGAPAAAPAGFHRLVAALGAHPPSDIVPEPGVEAALGGAPDVRVGPAPRPDGAPDAWLRTGPVTAPALAPPEEEGKDLLALRLALLALPHADPASLPPDSLAAADRQLRRWRALTARWADSPSRPVPAGLRRQADACVADGLDTPAVLDLMGAVARGDELPDGAKFEAFALLDGVLGLELARDVGRGVPTGDPAD
ncbi:hypothetical protein GCM10018793_46040 [Streptomyces sulfonofaciens]|uniref:Cysteinyl-tRNA synthetase n=1 Tax=Streptomyces sulfonofaciens TaxID=68272 RepID=A0A919GEW4_9ACTN|nr:hypothetical protein [Streptomyces sulfonofaciens]GHH83587.1 hypothetical protein GCM10018793_46040 [Streptomyces sulfonofaciens]